MLGSDCPTGQTCTLTGDVYIATLPPPRPTVTTFGYCEPPGDVGEGQACNTNGYWNGEKCAAGLTCANPAGIPGADKCKRLCHGSGDCSSGQTCTMPSGYPSGIGICG